MQSVYFKFLKYFYGELMHTNHDSVCLININLFYEGNCLHKHKAEVYNAGFANSNELGDNYFQWQDEEKFTFCDIAGFWGKL